MNNNPLVSVVIPVYNTEKYVGRAIESVISQTYTNIEIIIIDDGSPDNSYIIIEKYQKYDKRIKFIRQDNMGLSGARNTGIKNMTGEYVVFLDSDDTLTKNAIDILVNKTLEKNSDAVIATSYYKVIESSGNKILCKHFDQDLYINDPIEYALRVLIEKGRGWRATGLLYKSSIIKEKFIKFPEGYISEDFTFNLLFLQEAKKIDFLNDVTLNYLKRNGSITMSFNENYLESILYIDKIANNFLLNNALLNDINIRRKDSLMCRNIVTYLITVMSKKNSMPYREKCEFAEVLINHTEVKKVFSKAQYNPYFENRLIIIYFRFIYFLLNLRLNKLSIFMIHKVNLISGN